MSIAHEQIGAFLNSLASKAPAPGGGAAAPVVGATGCAAGEMAIAYSIGRKSLASRREELERAAGALRACRERLLALADEDAAAFERLGPLLSLAADDPRRAAELPGAARAAIGAPLEVIGQCVAALRAVAGLEGALNPHLKSDMGIGAELMEAAARASRWNVAVNAPVLREAAPSDPDPLPAADELLREASELRDRVAGFCA